MKKMLLGCALFIIAAGAQVSAQANHQFIDVDSFQWGMSTTRGLQTIKVPGGKGTIKFDKERDSFKNVVYTDAEGNTFRLAPVRPGTDGAPKPSCKYPLPDACFATANKNIGMCICKPTDLTSNSGGDYTIALLLPAVQKVRVAAATQSN